MNQGCAGWKAAPWVARRGLRSVRIGFLNPHIIDSQKVVKGISALNPFFNHLFEKYQNFTIFNYKKYSNEFYSNSKNPIILFNFFRGKKIFQGTRKISNFLLIINIFWARRYRKHEILVIFMFFRLTKNTLKPSFLYYLSSIPGNVFWMGLYKLSLH